MKIAIFHNLEKGGALTSLIETTKQLKRKNNVVDIYTLNTNTPPKIADNVFLFKIAKTKNIWEHVLQVIFELSQVNKRIAENINGQNYDLVLVFPCILTQTPQLLRFLSDKTTTIYLFQEPKREFYENTSLGQNFIKRKLIILVRQPIKLFDILNCKRTTNIISNSQYSSHLLKKIYGKNSFTVRPSMEDTPPTLITKPNHHNVISVGLFSKIKGHDFSIKQTASTNGQLTIIGRRSDDYRMIVKLAQRHQVKLSIIHTENEKNKLIILRRHSIYLANQGGEPFGIATLEATDNSCFVLGKNEGGTPEIIKNGLNGVCYPSSIKYATKTLKSTLKKNRIIFYKTCKINWDKYTDNLLTLYHHLKHEPAE